MYPKSRKIDALDKKVVFVTILHTTRYKPFTSKSWLELFETFFFFWSSEFVVLEFKFLRQSFLLVYIFLVC